MALSTKKENTNKTDDEDEGYFAGPRVSFVFQDVVAKPRTLGMIYHATSTPIAFFSPVGALVGGALSATGLSKSPARIAMGNGALVGGGAGAALGLALLCNTAMKGEDASPPWNQDGLDDRMYRIQNNFKVRVLDLGMWTGLGLGGAALYYAGGSPANFGLNGGRLGKAQALGLGIAALGVASCGCIWSTSRNKDGE